jgi:hypothetical protein
MKLSNIVALVSLAAMGASSPVAEKAHNAVMAVTAGTKAAERTLPNLFAYYMDHALSADTL